MTIAHMVIIFLSDSDTIAGVMATPEGKTEGALKTQFGRNHLAHFAFFMALKEPLDRIFDPIVALSCGQGLIRWKSLHWYQI